MEAPKGKDKSTERAVFVAENADLLKRCCSTLSKERKQHLRELVAKARAHFDYSEKTIDQDILRPLIRAYSKYVAQQGARVAPNILLHPTRESVDGTMDIGGQDLRNSTGKGPVRWD